jgi:uracil-DNA glycosylase
MSDSQLARWEPGAWQVFEDWSGVTQAFFDGSTGRELGAFVQQRLDAGATVYPPKPLRALEMTALVEVRVVIIGQDPYHGPGQAEGLAFSVRNGLPLPPSLRNIFAEIAQEGLGGMPVSPNGQPQGSLMRWAEQGVLLLNTALTVERGQPASHADRGWEVLTDVIVSKIAESEQPVVFMLWGAHAQKRRPLLNAGGAKNQHHLVLVANHPSPFSALKPPIPFMGCGHFAKANAFLQAHGGQAIAW